jgi:hypothetical protein
MNEERKQAAEEGYAEGEPGNVVAHVAAMDDSQRTKDDG